MRENTRPPSLSQTKRWSILVTILWILLAVHSMFDSLFCLFILSFYLRNKRLFDRVVLHTVFELLRFSARLRFLFVKLNAVT